MLIYEHLYFAYLNQSVIYDYYGIWTNGKYFYSEKLKKAKVEVVIRQAEVEVINHD